MSVQIRQSQAYLEEAWKYGSGVTPSSFTDAKHLVSKEYADTLFAGLHGKEASRLATFAPAGVQASLVTGSGNGEVTYTNYKKGAPGNNNSVEHLGGISQSFSITVTGTDGVDALISVQLATDGGGIVTTTANDLADAINNHGQAGLILQAVPGGTGLDPAAVVAETNLSGGAFATSGAPDTVDGISVAQNDRILVKEQNYPIENGIYVVDTVGGGNDGTWSRATDLAAGDHAAGAFIFSLEGVKNADKGWFCTTDAPNDVVGTDAISFVIFTAVGGTYSAGNGIDITNFYISVFKSDPNGSGEEPGLKFSSGDNGLMVLAGNGIAVTSTGVDVKPSEYGFDSFDPVDTGYLDFSNIPVMVTGMKDDTLITSPSPVIGNSYVVAGTGGDWSGFSVDDIVQCVDNKAAPADWRKIGVLGATKIAVQVAKTPAGSFTGHGSKVAFWDGNTTWTFHSPVEFDGVRVTGVDGVNFALYFGQYMIYSGGSWHTLPRLATSNSGLAWGYTGLEVDTDDTSVTVSTALTVVVDNAGGLTGGTGLKSSNNGLKLNPLVETAGVNLWDGNNKDWTLTDKAMESFIIITLNGQVCQKDGSGQGTYTYTMATKVVHFDVAPTAGALVQCYSFKNLD